MYVLIFCSIKRLHALRVHLFIYSCVITNTANSYCLKLTGPECVVGFPRKFILCNAWIWKISGLLKRSSSVSLNSICFTDMTDELKSGLVFLPLLRCLVPQQRKFCKGIQCSLLHLGI